IVLPLLPGPPGLGDLLKCPRDEVPPHLDLRAERLPAQQEEPSRPRAFLDAKRVETRGNEREGARLDDGLLDLDRPVDGNDAVFEPRGEWDVHGAAEADVEAEGRVIHPSRRTGAVELPRDDMGLPGSDVDGRELGMMLEPRG